MVWIRLTDARALQDQRRAEGTAADNDLFACFIHLEGVLTWGERLCWDRLDADCAAALNDDFLDLGIDFKVKILVNRAGGMYVSVRGVFLFSLGSHN